MSLSKRDLFKAVFGGVLSTGPASSLPKIGAGISFAAPVSLPLMATSVESAYGMLALDLGDFLFPDNAEYGVEKGRYATTHDELSTLVFSDRDLRYYHPASSIVNEYICKVMKILMISEQDWKQIIANQGFCCELAEHAEGYKIEQQNNFNQVMKSATTNALGNHEQLKHEIYDNVSFVDQWLLQWNEDFLELARKRFSVNISNLSLAEYGDLDAKTVCEIIEREIDFGDWDEGVFVNPLKDLKSKLSALEDDQAALNLMKEFGRYGDAYRLYLLGKKFQNRTVGLDVPEKCPYWNDLDAKERLHHMVEILYFKSADHMAGVFVTNPEILAHFVVDRGLNIGRSTAATKSQQYLESYVSSFGQPLYIERSLAQICTSEVSADCEGLLPYTAHRMRELHRQVLASVQRKLVLQVLEDNTQKRLLSELVRVGLLRLEQGEIILSITDPVQANQVMAQVVSYLGGDINTQKLEVISGGDRGHKIISLDDALKTKFFEEIGDGSAKEVISPASPTVPQSAPHSTRHPCADCR